MNNVAGRNLMHLPLDMYLHVDISDYRTYV